MAILSLDEIINNNDITVKEHNVPEWNGSVKIRSISKRQMRDIKNSSRDEATGEINSDLVEKQVFMHGMVEPEVDDDKYEVLLDKSSSAMDGILKAILENSNLTGDKGLKKEEATFPQES